MAEQLKSMIGICDGFNFVLPAEMIAETISGVAVSSMENPQPWQAGHLNWNGLNVPVVSMEQMIISRRPRLRGSHVVIIRGTTDTETLPFYGIPIQTMPNEYQLMSTMDIVQAPIPDGFSLVTMVARIRGVNCVVPDFETLERQVASDLKVMV